MEITLERIVIKTEEEVQSHRFLGSPTIRINDLDVDPSARTLTDYGFT